MSREQPNQQPDFAVADEILDGLGVVFASLGRALLCVGPDFRVVHASAEFDALLGEGTAASLRGLDVREVLGPELFSEEARFRQALQAGERREGWATTLRTTRGPSLLVSISSAPIIHPPDGNCDPRVAFVVVLRPEEMAPGGGQTAFAGLVARAPSMLKLFELIEKLSESEATVLITGESGTGKELIARAVHQYSPRRRGPFVAVNCGALPPELLESELFGHVRGAFTGAYRDRSGRFELASEGTLFLDEVTEMPLHLQVKLLRVLQEGTFERVGESESRRTGARVVAAANRDLRQAISEGELREDLYYRLRVVPIEIPPLRRRREDIEPLARHLLTKIARRHGRSILLDPAVMQALLAYDWPGNVRELENALEYSLAVSDGQTIHVHDLPLELQEAAAGVGSLAVAPMVAPTDPEPGAMQHSDEAGRILAVLERTRWKREEAARELGMSRSTLWRKIKALGLDR